MEFDLQNVGENILYISINSWQPYSQGVIIGSITANYVR